MKRWAIFHEVGGEQVRAGYKNSYENCNEARLAVVDAIEGQDGGEITSLLIAPGVTLIVGRANGYAVAFTVREVEEHA